MLLNFSPSKCCWCVLRWRSWVAGVLPHGVMMSQKVQCGSVPLCQCGTVWPVCLFAKRETRSKPRMQKTGLQLRIGSAISLHHQYLFIAKEHKYIMIRHSAHVLSYTLVYRTPKSMRVTCWQHGFNLMQWRCKSIFRCSIGQDWFFAEFAPLLFSLRLSTSPAAKHVRQFVPKPLAGRETTLCRYLTL